MADKQIKEVIHAKGLDIEIYTTDFENAFTMSPSKWINVSTLPVLTSEN